MRRLCWEPPVEPSQESVAEVLKGHGARPWQIEQVAPILTEALLTDAG